MEKTVITYSGDVQLFEAVKNNFECDLPKETIQWKRNYGRASKNVILNPKFEQFDPQTVSSSSSLKSLLGQPLLHIFWAECMDFETYKNTTKDEVQNWITTLKKCGSPHDWIVVLVETPDSRKVSNKLLPRTSVLDKLKTDVGTKYSDRCFTLIDPAKTDSKAVDSWQTLLHRIRLLLLQAYNRALMRFEENMRGERENRNDSNWNFCDYFLLQEELAFVYEMLGVYDEALVQYDELDALFTQFILNSNVTESPQWLISFCNRFSDWSGLSLDSEENKRLRMCIIQKTPSILDVRNYLFARQSQLLLNLNRPWEVARRCLSFLHNGVHELSILDVSCPKGSLDCWILLSAQEVLKTCQECSQASTNQMQQYCLFTAELWSYCREKLLNLGELCGLLPKWSEPTSDQLHFVVELSSGIRDKTGPVERLKEALSSKIAFQKYYLELSESAISTYKHIGRIRSARMVGLELAKFYSELGQVQKALTFLVDGLKTFEVESWSLLEVQTLIETAKCYQQLDDHERLARTCAQLACAPCLLTSEEKFRYCVEMADTADLLDHTTFVNAEQLLGIKILNLSTPAQVTPGSNLELQIEIHSRFPQEIPMDEMMVSLTFSEPITSNPIQEDTSSPEKRSLVTKNKRIAGRHSRPSSMIQRTPSNRSTTSTTSSLMSLETVLDEDTVDSQTTDTLDEASADGNRLEMCEHFDYKQDKSLACVRLVCKNASRVLKRKDSSGTFLKEGYVKKSDFTHCFNLTTSTERPFLKPGPNVFTLNTTAKNTGQYTVNQLCIKILNRKMELLSENWLNPVKIKMRYNVITESHNFKVTMPSIKEEKRPFLAGFQQKVHLDIFTGSHSFNEKNDKIRVKCSHGMTILRENDDDENNSSNNTSTSLILEGLKAEPFQSISVPLLVKADLCLSKDGTFIEHRFIIEDPWEIGQETVLQLHFRPPFTTTSKIQTALTRKFIQLAFQSNCEDDEAIFALKNPSIECETSKEISFKPINPAYEVLVLKRHSVSNFMWEVLSEDLPNELKLKVKVFYGRHGTEQNTSEFELERFPFIANFDFKEFKTQYLLKCKIDPAKGGELCRASSICALSITVEQLSKETYKSLMYEVLADQGLWAVCGQAAGVIDMETAKKQTLLVEVMPLTGGHLALPKVRLSKYIPPAGNQKVEIPNDASKAPSSGNMPRLEPFAPGQVYNQTRTARVHVLPAPNAHTHQASLGSNFGSNPGIHDVKSNQHASLPFY